MLGREFGSLADVRVDVVELDLLFVVELDEFPIAGTDGRAGCPGAAVIMRVVPHDGLLTRDSLMTGSSLAGHEKMIGERTPAS